MLEEKEFAVVKVRGRRYCIVSRTEPIPHGCEVIGRSDLFLNAYILKKCLEGGGVASVASRELDAALQLRDNFNGGNHGMENK